MYIYIISLDNVTTLIFIIEMLLKVFALTPIGYVRDKFNIIDCLIVILAVLDFGNKFLESFK